MKVIKNIVISEEAPNLKEVGWLKPLNDGTFKLMFYGPSGWVDGASGIKGDEGTTFTPSVSNEGVVSWSNNGGLENPEEVNIKGPSGDYPISMELNLNESGGVTGGTVTLSDNSSFPITIINS